MFSLFKRSSAQPLIMTLTLNARLMPIIRGDLEDAFDTICSDNGIDAHVVGGGTHLADNHEVSACDIEVQLGSPDLVDTVVRLFEALLAPVGSHYSVGDGDPVPFGRKEGLGLYLNGTDLPAEVYASADVNFVYQECDRLTEGVGRVHGHWEGPTETALYLYGTSFAELHERLQPLLTTYPLCEKARIVQIA